MSPRPRIGRYELLSMLGRGGMADVYRVRLAEQPEFRREFALKVTHRKADLNLFRAEAHLSSQIDHPNIVRALDFGEHKGRLYLLLELVEGATLAVCAPYLRGDALDHELLCYIGAQVCVALEHIHGEPLHVVHRDLTQKNILLSIFGEVKLLDFGIAKYAERAIETRTLVTRGTPEYMSPEQLNGSRQLDARTDIFSLGVLLYELAAGFRPFAGVEKSDLRHIERTIRAGLFTPLDELVPEIPPPLAALIHRMLAYLPEDRPTVPEVRAALTAGITHGRHLAGELGSLVRRAQRHLVTPETGTESLSDSAPLSTLNIDPVTGTLEGDEDDPDDSEEDIAVETGGDDDPASQAHALPAAAPRSAASTGSKTRAPQWIAALAAAAMVGGIGLALGKNPAPSTPPLSAAPEAVRSPTSDPTSERSPSPSDVTHGDTLRVAVSDTPDASMERAPPRGATHASATPISWDAGAERGPAARSTATRSTKTASLTVIVTPWGDFWIGDTFYGQREEPITALRPGRYTIHFGQGVKQQHCEVTLVPGPNVFKFKLHSACPR